MENKIQRIKELISAFESRNEKLHDEINNNKEAIEALQNELEEILSENDKNVIKVA